MTTTDAQTVTARALIRCIIALTAVFVISVVLSPPKAVAHWVTGGLYLFVLLGGLLGSIKRTRCMLRMYWIAQFIVLLVTLGSIVLGIVLMVQSMKTPATLIQTSTVNSGDSTSSSSTTTVSADTTTTVTTSNADSTTTTTVGGTQSEIEHHETMMTSHSSPAVIIVNVAYLVVFLMILAIKVRSILLAQKLLKQIDEMPYMDDSQFELESQQALNAPGSEYNVVETQQYSQPTAASQPVYFVQAHYLPGAQTDLPTNVPMVLVDQYGKVVTPQN